MKRYIISILISIAFILLALPTEQAQAIPAFARKYKKSCNTCHVAMPKLKAFGDEFAGNGFMMPGVPEPKRAHVKTGDDQLMLMKDVPLAVRFDAFIQASDRDLAKTDFQTPYGIKLLSGGPISNHVSYYFYFFFDERGEVAGLEDAYLHFNNIGNTDFDIMFGQFQVSDPLFKRELRLTFEDYLIYKARPGNSQANLTYDRGLMMTYGFDFGLDLAALVLNGNGIKPAVNRLYDSDNNKNFALRASQDFGFLRFGLFGYNGNENNGSAENKITMFGPDVTLGGDTWELNGQYMHREDDNPFFSTGNAVKENVDGGFAELIFMPQGDQSMFLYTLLYNKITSDSGLSDYETYTASISHMAARNIRILAEGTYDKITEKYKFTLGVVSAF